MTSVDRLVVLNDVSIAHGGATGLALLEVELFAKLGIAVSYVTGDDGGNPLLTDWGVSVVPLGERRLLNAGALKASMRGLNNKKTRDTLGDWIRRYDSPGTIYHLHGWSQILSPSVFAALAAVRARTFITAHDFFLVCPNGAYANFAQGTRCLLKPLGAECLLTQCDKRSYVHKLWRTARQISQSRSLKFADGHPTVLMIHPAMREPLERGGVPGGCLKTLPNPVTPWSASRIEAESNHDFLFVGRLATEKGPDLALAAARRAGLRLIVIGDGPLLADLREAYPEATFLGRLPPEDIARHARTSRALIMPSRYPEPYGLVAVEALWSGLPVISTASALLSPDLVGRGAGLACDPTNESDLADAMSKLAGDDQLVRRLSLNAHERTRDLALTPAAWADALLTAFEGQLETQVLLKAS